MSGRSPLRGSGHSPKGGAAISVASPAKPSVPNAARSADDELAYLRGQREYFINAIVEDGEILRDVKAWLAECHDWLLTNDLDMQCPMQVDPLDLIDRIDKRHSFPALAGEAGTAETTQIGSVHEHATAKPERPYWIILIIAVSLSIAVVSALWIVGGVL